MYAYFSTIFVNQYFLLLEIYLYILIQLLETKDWLILFFNILFILILFVSVCLHMCVNVYVCVCKHACGNLRTTWDVIPQGPPSFYLRQGISLT